MKIKTFSILTCVLLLTLTATPPPVTHAGTWLDDLFECTGAYMYGLANTWDVYNNSNHTQSDVETRNAALTTLFYNYQSCNGTATAPVIDFCTSAIIASDNCDAQYAGTGLEYTSGYMACRAASGVDNCR